MLENANQVFFWPNHNRRHLSIFIGILIFILSILIWVFPSLYRTFGLVPAYTIYGNGAKVLYLETPFLWNLITCNFCESSGGGIIGLLLSPITAFAFILVSYALEEFWGLKTYLLFILYSSFFCGLLCFISSIISYYITLIPDYLYSPFASPVGLLAAFSVGVKQASSCEAVRLGGRISLNINAEHLPVATFGWSLILFLLIGDWRQLIMSLTGIITGWTYLRYFMFFKLTAVTGDRSHDFDFYTLFSPILRPILAFINRISRCQPYYRRSNFQEDKSEEKRNLEEDNATRQVEARRNAALKMLQERHHP
eukprot:GHVL01002785.1.p1 GENE.GHVL01002785.1~~GHVL01002785.1.p1  ORF type:complete len:310 (-),score=14.62 GHVL01002785.1:817-1746(-)